MATHTHTVFLFVLLWCEPSLASVSVHNHEPWRVGTRLAPTSLRAVEPSDKNEALSETALLQTTSRSKGRDTISHIIGTGLSRHWITDNIFILIFAMLVLVCGALGVFKVYRQRKSKQYWLKHCPFVDKDVPITMKQNPCLLPVCQPGTYDAGACDAEVTSFCLNLGVKHDNAGCAKYANGLSQVQAEYMWVCLRDIYPVTDTEAMGLSHLHATLMSSYATHVYILHGHSLNDARAWDFTIENNDEAWNELLSNVKETASKDVRFPAEYAEKMAAHIHGRSHLNELGGLEVHDLCAKCFKSRQPSSCTTEEVRQLANDYLETHDQFTLGDQNCAAFGCTMLHHCLLPSPGESPCDIDECKQGIMYKPLDQKSPQCGMREDPMNHLDNLPLGSDTLSRLFFLGRTD